MENPKFKPNDIVIVKDYYRDILYWGVVQNIMQYFETRDDKKPKHYVYSIQRHDGTVYEVSERSLVGIDLRDYNFMKALYGC